MQHLARSSMAALLVIAAGDWAVNAQTFNSTNPTAPAVNPIININRGGAPAGVNYYAMVQPQQQLYTALGRQNGTAAYNYGLTDIYGQVISTGHAVQFGNLTHFYTYGGINTGTGTSANRAAGFQQRPTPGFGSGAGSGTGLGYNAFGQGGMGIGGQGGGMVPQSPTLPTVPNVSGGVPSVPGSNR